MTKTLEAKAAEYDPDDCQFCGEKEDYCYHQLAAFARAELEGSWMRHEYIRTALDLAHLLCKQQAKRSDWCGINKDVYEAAQRFMKADARWNRCSEYAARLGGADDA